MAHFRHRDAVRPRPTYASQRDSGADRIHRQRWALRQKMGDTCSDLFGEPYKPKVMHWRTYERHAARDAELEARDAALLAGLLGRMGCPLDGFGSDLPAHLGSLARARMTSSDKPRKQANPRQRVPCGATRHRDGQPCQALSEPGKHRCRFHGGRSTGPRRQRARPARWPTCGEAGAGAVKSHHVAACRSLSQPVAGVGVILEQAGVMRNPAK